MPLPKPEIGLIVHYAYVFRTSKTMAAGKHRPCLIGAVFRDPADTMKTGILYLPISHTPPGPEDAGIALSHQAKFVAGLDAAPQWILVSEGNQDTWPEDIANLPNRPGQFAYGFLPPGTLKSIQSAYARRFIEKKFNVVPRAPPTTPY
jgi:hypothetical protein